MPADVVELRLPDFQLGDVPITVCSWHAKAGQRVMEGDRVIDVLAGDVTIDLAAPASGILIERCVDIDERLHVNQLLAVIEAG
jgi:pyruvate/2-oxoglutarate dehydrogenase complex dihydrolipoamide acyltransferase (E2) component